MDFQKWHQVVPNILKHQANSTFLCCKFSVPELVCCVSRSRERGRDRDRNHCLLVSPSDWNNWFALLAFGSLGTNNDGRISSQKHPVIEIDRTGGIGPIGIDLIENRRKKPRGGPNNLQSLFYSILTRFVHFYSWRPLK